MALAGSDQRAWASWPAMLVTMLLLFSRTTAAEELGGDQQRGAEIFQKYCVLCHGASGRGDGRAALLQKARPADLTASARSDDYKLQIIRDGGSALQRSTSMPPWSQVLSETEMQDVVAFLRLLAQPTPEVIKPDTISQLRKR